jgi:hypothetical protein
MATMRRLHIEGKHSTTVGIAKKSLGINPGIPKMRRIIHGEFKSRYLNAIMHTSRYYYERRKEVINIYDFF